MIMRLGGLNKYRIMQGNKENISYHFRLTKFGKLGKSGLIESNLGDFGVRKYDYEIGRFTSEVK